MPRIPLLASAVVLALAAVPFMAVDSGCAEKVVELSVIPATPMPDLHTVGLNLTWQRQVTLDAGERITNAWRVGSSIYVASSMSRLSRINARSGVLSWSIGLGEENFHLFRPAEIPNPAGGTAKEVLVTSHGAAFVVNIETGEIARTADLGLSLSTDPLIIGNTLCVAGPGRYIGIYLDQLKGHHWVQNDPGDLFESTPVAVENSVIVASRSGLLWRLNAESGNWMWKDRKTNGAVTAGLAADTRAVYIPGLDQRVYAFRTETGGELWETTESLGTLETTPTLAGPLALIVSNEKGLYGLARSNGEIKWNVPGVSQVATASDTTAWVGGRDGTIRSISLETGAVLSSAPTEGVQIYLPNAVDSSVILISRAGLVGQYSGKAAP